MVTLIHNDKFEPSPIYKVSNFITINESLDLFGSEMRSRIRNKIENWKKTSASYRYIQFMNVTH